MSYNYGKEKQKDGEQFPKVMTKQDKDELVSIINKLNSEVEPKDKIGFNIQYRQVKIPANIYFSLKKKKKDYNQTLDKEKKNIILTKFEENKSIEENFERKKSLEIEDLNKKIKKLNNEYADLIRDKEIISNNSMNTDNTTKKLREDIDKIKSKIDIYQSEVNKSNQEYYKLLKEKDEKMERQEVLNCLEKYIKDKMLLIEEQKRIKKMLCYKCGSRVRMIFYCGCSHLALCKDCYRENKIFEKKCPICHKISELVVKILEENKNY